MSTKGKLRALIDTELKGAKFIAVSNGEPYTHNWSDRTITCTKPAGGLTAALDPIMQASGGVWIAHGAGSPDAETTDPSGRIAVPPDNPSYTLRRIVMGDQLHHEFYYGLANEGLWPLATSLSLAQSFVLETGRAKAGESDICRCSAGRSGGRPCFRFRPGLSFCSPAAHSERAELQIDCGAVLAYSLAKSLKLTYRNGDQPRPIWASPFG
jgi:hypothetical protein